MGGVHAGFGGCCILQNCRDREGVPQLSVFQRLDDTDFFEDGAIGRFDSESVLFQEALGSLGSFYSHPKTVVLMLTHLPADYDDSSVYTSSGNAAPFFDRGWCFFESSLATLTKLPGNLVDLGPAAWCAPKGGTRALVSGAARRPAPVLPDALDAELQSKSFTNGREDRPRVAELYRSAFVQRLLATEALTYVGLGWGDDEAQPGWPT
ncbi:unnamed protein product [Prorocentrum cordatum]|uniref:Uncharacterized protein n=1 Tax=Prorocentrum cordatum TaxID=2364126 RepID=A0ABN9SBI1_9DINO|nr:unnamed protein product [Polarella glacialis]